MKKIISQRIKKLTHDITLILISITFATILLETCLRFLRPEYKYAAKSKFVADKFRIWENPRNTSYIRKHPDLNQQHLVFHNSLGFRQHRDFSFDKPKNSIRIGFFGDSMTENLRMESQYSFTEPLDYLLNKTGKNYEVMNFGTDGYGTDQVYLQYIQEGTKLDLDYIFYVYSNNDLRNILENNIIDVNSDGILEFKEYKRKKWISLVKNLYITYLFIDFFYRFGIDLELRLDRYENEDLITRHAERFHNPRYIDVQYNFSEGRFNDDVNYTLDIFITILREMRKIASENDAQFYIVILISESDARMHNFLTARGFESIKFYDDFNDIYKKNEYRFKNDAHWNEEGNKLAAILLFKFLAEKMSIEYDGEKFIEQSLYEYYSSYAPFRVTNLFLRKHEAFPLDLNHTIRSKYLAIEN
jgi:hypothetical protein